MALNDILTSMDGARDALVTAINAKGGSLAQDSTLYQCADAVGSLSGGTSAEYYKCASVDTGGTVLDESTLIASGFGTRYGFEVDGTYTLRSGSGTDRVYVKGSIILSYNTGSSCWEFTAPDFEPDPLALTSASCETPWDATSWITVAGSPLSGATVSRSETTTSGSTWSGYKAVFDSGTGTWSFESDVTEGLTYTSVTPVVGVIYTIDALVTVASVYTGFYATSSPLNPSSNNSGVWEITASSFLDSNRNAYKAFDEDLNSDRGCWHSQSGMPQWIQWRNTESKVLIKSYFLQNRSGGAGDYYPVEWTLSGSDDGVDWTELDNVVIQDSDTASGSKTLRNLASNNTAYYYHRITVTKAYYNSYATIGFLQAFNYLQE